MLITNEKLAKRIVLEKFSQWGIYDIDMNGIRVYQEEDDINGTYIRIEMKGKDNELEKTT